jgi:cell wall-associated NlpC family hydrolase
VAVAVSGTGVALATAGGVLLYAGLKGESPLVALREIVKGGPSPLKATPGAGFTGSDLAVTAATDLFNTGAAGVGVVAGGVVGAFAQLAQGFGSALVDAMNTFRNDRYSEAQRWAVGYSDCSSIVGKSLKLLHITPPGASTTPDYLAWGVLYKVPALQAKAGDLLVNTAHMAVVTGPGTAMGQQNPRRNVATGTFDSIMAGTGAYLVLRFVNEQTDKLTPAQAAAAKKALGG